MGEIINVSVLLVTMVLIVKVRLLTKQPTLIKQNRYHRVQYLYLISLLIVLLLIVLSKRNVMMKDPARTKKLILKNLFHWLANLVEIRDPVELFSFDFKGQYFFVLYGETER